MSGKNILENLKEIFLKNGHDEVLLLEAGEEGISTPVLSVLLRGFGSVSNLAEGEFFFAERKDAKPDYFVSRIRILPEVDPKFVSILCLKAGLVNPDLYAGCFEYDPLEGDFSYVLKIPLVSGLSEKELTEIADSCIATALSVSGEYAGDFIAAGKTGML